MKPQVFKITKARVGLRAEGAGKTWEITDLPPLLQNLFGIGWGDHEVFAYMSLHRTKSNGVTVSYFQFTTGFDKVETSDGPYIQGRLDL